MSGFQVRWARSGRWAGRGTGGWMAARPALPMLAVANGRLAVVFVVGGHDLDDQPLLAAVLARLQLCCLDHDGIGDVDHDAHLAGRGQAAAEALDEADAFLSRASPATATLMSGRSMMTRLGCCREKTWKSATCARGRPQIACACCCRRASSVCAGNCGSRFAGRRPAGPRASHAQAARQCNWRPAGQSQRVPRPSRNHVVRPPSTLNGPNGGTTPKSPRKMAFCGSSQGSVMRR